MKPQLTRAGNGATSVAQFRCQAPYARSDCGIADTTNVQRSAALFIMASQMQFGSAALPNWRQGGSHD